MILEYWKVKKRHYSPHPNNNIQTKRHQQKDITFLLHNLVLLCFAFQVGNKFNISLTFSLIQWIIYENICTACLHVFHAEIVLVKASMKMLSTQKGAITKQGMNEQGARWLIYNVINVGWLENVQGYVPYNINFTVNSANPNTYEGICLLYEYYILCW